MPWQNAGTPIQALGLVKRTGFDARSASRPANTQTVLNNVSLDIDGAGLTAIVGPSGAGKTSLLYVLSGLDRPDSGRVTIGGTDVYALNEERRSRFIRGHIGFVFQQYNLVPYLTVEENVAFPLVEAGWKDRQKIKAAVLETLASVDLEEHLHKLPSDLSGGMRKRAALARAIITDPQAVFYDEPTSGLDPVVADSIDHLIRRTQRRRGITSVVVTHDMKCLRVVADQVFYLREGVVYFSGTPAELLESADPVIRQFVEGRSGESS